MDPEIKKLLQENLDLSKENNKLLRKIRNHERWSAIGNTIYWVLIIGIAVGAFYFLQPYFDRVVSTVTNIEKGLNAFSQTTSKF